MRSISPRASVRESLLESAVVDLGAFDGSAHIEIQPPRIVLGYEYYRHGSPVDIYLDVLHEIVHLRQLSEGCELWDSRFAYVDRPTEIEGYAVAVGEAMRLGMSREQILDHLTNPWMSEADVRRLYANVIKFMADRIET